MKKKLNGKLKSTFRLNQIRRTVTAYEMNRVGFDVAWLIY